MAVKAEREREREREYQQSQKALLFGDLWGTHLNLKLSLENRLAKHKPTLVVVVVAVVVVVV